MGSSGTLLAGTVKRNFTIHRNRHELVIFCVLELHDLMTTPRQLPPSAWLLRVLSIAWYSCPPTVNAAVLRCWRLVWRTGIDLPSTLTDVLVINCVAIDFRVSASITSSFSA